MLFIKSDISTRNYKRNPMHFDIKQDISSQILGYRQQKPKVTQDMTGQIGK